MGYKGCVVFSSEALYEYRDYATKVDEELSTLSWLYHMNHGIFMTPGVDEQWTLSVAHSDDELQRYSTPRGVCARRDGLASRHAARHLLGLGPVGSVVDGGLAVVAPAAALDPSPSSSLLVVATAVADGIGVGQLGRRRRRPTSASAKALSGRFKRGRPRVGDTPPDHADEPPDTVWERERKRRGLTSAGLATLSEVALPPLPTSPAAVATATSSRPSATRRSSSCGA